MTTDANRPCPDPLTAETVFRELHEFIDPKYCHVVADMFNKLLADRLAQAQRDAEQAALEMAAEFVHENLMYEEGCDFDLPKRLRELRPGTALELMKLRERRDEAKRAYGQWKLSYADCGPRLKERIAELTARKIELERQPATKVSERE